MKTLIAVPAMSMVHTGFMTSLLSMARPGESSFGITEGTLIHSARNILAQHAVEGGFDRILWIDSDMRVPYDMMQRMGKDLDEGREFVCGLFVMRIYPSKPVIYSDIKREDGRYAGIIYHDYPKDKVFPIAACGFGAVMMTTRLYLKAKEKAENPFAPIENLGEDMSFCLRLKDIAPLYCDSRIKVPHIGLYDYTENDVEVEE